MDERYIISIIGKIHHQANKFIEKELKRNKVERLATSHGDILFQLYKNESLTMQQLSNLINRDKSTVTVLVNKLVALGYVSKTSDTQDARVSNLSITQKGKKLRPIFYIISQLSRLNKQLFYKGRPSGKKMKVSDEQPSMLLHLA